VIWLGKHILPRKHRITSIVEVIHESNDVRTVVVEDEFCSKAKPGQFAMVWVPSVGESPMCIYLLRSKLKVGFTVKPLGLVSSALANVKEGSVIGVTGPFGNSFTPITGSSLVVGGGTGLAPLIPLCRDLVDNGGSVTLILSGRSKESLIFLSESERMFSSKSMKLVVATDDGSLGYKGVASDCVDELLKNESYDMIYTCGPEIMMKKIFLSAEEKKIDLQASLERYMKCGIGLCGSCAIGKYLVCVDGPVFDSYQLREVAGEFGVFTRDSSGSRIPLVT